jgi:hypothetical protein
VLESKSVYVWGGVRSTDFGLSLLFAPADEATAPPAPSPAAPAQQPAPAPQLQGGLANLTMLASLPAMAQVPQPAQQQQQHNMQHHMQQPQEEEADVGRAIVTQKTVDINNMEDGYKWRK